MRFNWFKTRRRQTKAFFHLMRSTRQWEIIHRWDWETTKKQGSKIVVVVDWLCIHILGRKVYCCCCCCCCCSANSFSYSLCRSFKTSLIRAMDFRTWFSGHAFNNPFSQRIFSVKRSTFFIRSLLSKTSVDNCCLRASPRCVARTLRSLSNTYQSLCKSSNDFWRSSLAVHERPTPKKVRVKTNKRRAGQKCQNWSHLS